MPAPKYRPIKALPQPTFRSIEPALAAALGVKPTLEWVEPASLCVEENYQRDLSEKSITLIRRIVANWRWSKIKPVICVRVGNRLVVIDGQHTAIAAASHGGIEKVPVMVVTAGTVKERAEAFISQNRDRLALTAVHMHYAALAAREEIAVAVDEACKLAGVTILRSSKGGHYRVGDTFATGIIRRIVGKIGVKNGAKVLRVLVAAKRAPLLAHEIAAVHQLLFDPELKGTIETFDLTTVIRSKSPDQWRAAAATALATGKADSRRGAFAEAFLAALKRRRR